MPIKTLEWIEGEGLLLLGRSLYEIGEYPEARPVLAEALEKNPARRSEIHMLLATAYFRDTSSDLTKARDHIDRYLSDQALSESDRERGLIQKSRILFRLGDFKGAHEALAPIPESSDNVHAVFVMRGRMLLNQARQKQAQATAVDDESLRIEARQLFDQAIERFRSAQQQETIDKDSERTAMYLVGRCLLETGQVRAALAQLERTRRLHYGSPQGLVAEFYEAELLAQSRRDDRALIGYRRVLGQLGDPRRFTNLWITLDELRRGMLRAYDHFQHSEQFEKAVEMAGRFRPLFDEARAMELEAAARYAWGDTLVQKAKRLVLQERQRTEADARRRYREAGALYLKLTKLRVATRHYPNDLWRAAESYLEGQNYRIAHQLLQTYLDGQLLRRRPQALVAHAEVLLALDRHKEALEKVDECLESYGRDVASFRARLLASRAYLEMDQIESAEELLVANLQSDLLTPQSKEWRQSLFELGRLLHLDGRFEQAIERLDEAVTRYPDDAQALEATYMLADSYYQLARALSENVETETVERARRGDLRKIKDDFTNALAHYTHVHEVLTRAQSDRIVSPIEQSILRNCYFARGAVLIGLARYTEAIEVYSTATNRYQRAPVGLEAYLQIAHCYRLLSQPDAARNTMQQAKVVLKRMDEDVDFARATNFTRAEWEDLLEWLSSL